MAPGIVPSFMRYRLNIILSRIYQDLSFGIFFTSVNLVLQKENPYSYSFFIIFFFIHSLEMKLIRFHWLLAVLFSLVPFYNWSDSILKQWKYRCDITSCLQGHKRPLSFIHLTWLQVSTGRPCKLVRTVHVRPRGGRKLRGGEPKESEQERHLAIRGQVSYTLSIDCRVGWTTRKTLPFYSKNSGPIFITSCSREKRYQALPGIHICVPEQGSLGTRLLHFNVQKMGGLHNESLSP